MWKAASPASSTARRCHQAPARTYRLAIASGSCWSPGPNAKKWFDDYRSKVSAKPISGLGDEAYYDGYASISVLKGDAYVRIAVGIANNLSPEETLARDALPRM